MRRAAFLIVLLAAVAACGGEPEPTTGPPASPSAVDGCPERYLAADREPWVPAPPATETPGRLVPDADPVEALVCRYGGDPAGLVGAVRLEGGLDHVRTDLLVPARVGPAAPRCRPVEDGVPHLLRLRYADGELWVAAVHEPDACGPTGNGAFVSSAALGGVLARAYDSATWPAVDADPCAGQALGRAGQERALAPEGWTSLVVCTEDGSRRDVPADLAGQATSLVAQVPAQPGPDACEGTPTEVSRLVLRYAAGPPVVVRWTPGCEPSLHNGTLSAALTPAQTELLGVLVG